MSVLDQSMVASDFQHHAEHVRTIDLSDVGQRRLNNMLKFCVNVETLVLTIANRVKHVRYALKCPKLRAVRLCLLENTTLSLKDFPSHITELTLQACVVCDLKELTRFTCLEKLDLDQSQLLEVNDDGCFFEVPQTLKHLNVRGSGFPWEKYTLNNLESLHISPAPDKWWLHLSQFPNLKELDVEGPICDEALSYLLQMPNLQKVRLQQLFQNEFLFEMDHAHISQHLLGALRQKVKNVQI